MSAPLTDEERTELHQLEAALLGARFAQLGVAVCVALGTGSMGLLFTFVFGLLSMPLFLLQAPTVLALVVCTGFALQARAHPDALVRSLRAQAAWWWLVMLTGTLLALGTCGSIVSVFATF